MTVSCAILPNGNLRVTADNNTRSEIAAGMKRDYWATLWEVFERHALNGSFEPFDAGNGDPFVGLTSAPCVAETMTINDDGSKEIIGRLWWFPNYMVQDPLEELKNRGATEFTLAD
jgi:hypothetical protein